jgi:hypothetical protein
MSRFGVFWFILVIASGVMNFIVKQTVQSLDDKLTSVRRETVIEQKKIHELTADWTFLNQPELLTDLNNRYVHLVQMSPKQAMASIDTIPLRPTPPAPPPQNPAPQIAEAAAPAPVSPLVAQAAPTPPAAPVRSPIVPVSATAPARPPMAAPSTPAPSTAQTAPAAHAASLDGLFAQVAGDR